MTEPWIIYYGHQINLTTEEILNMRWGLFMDLMVCASIDNGGAEYKPKKATQEQVIFGMR